MGIFLRAFFCNCKSCVYNSYCDDRLSYNDSYFVAHDSWGRGDSHIKVIVMLVLWLSGVNFRFWFLLGLRVFGTESHYICPFRDHLGLCRKKFTKNAVTLTSQKSNF